MRIRATQAIERLNSCTVRATISLRTFFKPSSYISAARDIYQLKHKTLSLHRSFLHTNPFVNTPPQVTDQHSLAERATVIAIEKGRTDPFIDCLTLRNNSPISPLLRRSFLLSRVSRETQTQVARSFLPSHIPVPPLFCDLVLLPSDISQLRSYDRRILHFSSCRAVTLTTHRADKLTKANSPTDEPNHLPHSHIHNGRTNCRRRFGRRRGRREH